jgi:hypothetical protein
MPHHHTTNRAILVYEPNEQLLSSYMKTVKACDKLIDAIFAAKCKYPTTKRLHIKGKHYMYEPSDAYKIVRVKYTKK